MNRIVPWLAASLVATAAVAGIPADHRQLKAPISYMEMNELLTTVARSGSITVSEEATTARGRKVLLVHLSRGAEARFRVLFYAQQHGDESSGKDALLFMIRDIAASPELLPRDIDLWIMPMLNPDGAEANERRNSSGADLNRDHMLLTQPETQALHKVARRVMPHLAVDCHEFTRDSRDWADRGLAEWPIIMMDGANNPLFDAAVVSAGQRWVEAARPLMAQAGHPYVRYNVGGVPPDEEQRYSAFEPDDGRNGIGAYGGMSLIIEAGIKRAATDPNADLGQRVDAYLTLLRNFLADSSHRSEEIAAVEAARAAPLPRFIPTNYFWANAGPRITEVQAIDVATGREISIPTANFMHDMVIKSSVTTPAGYAIEPRATTAFRPLLERHGITFEVVATPRLVRVERCLLQRVEPDFDPVYNRYAGRQIVTREAAALRELAPGTLIVPLDQQWRVKAALLLEPTMLFGLFGYPEYRALTGPDKLLPVARILP